MIDKKILIKELSRNSIFEKVTVGEWIPCSERLPKEPDEQYIITNKYGEVDIATYDGLCYWYEYNPDEVIAWKPLPAPYNEKRGRKNE